MSCCQSKLSKDNLKPVNPINFLFHILCTIFHNWMKNNQTRKMIEYTDFNNSISFLQCFLEMLKPSTYKVKLLFKYLQSVDFFLVNKEQFLVWKNFELFFSSAKSIISSHPDTKSFLYVHFLFFHSHH